VPIRRIVIATFAYAGILVTHPAKAIEESYAVLHNGEKVGAVQVHSNGDTLHIDYSESDNGRGPKLQQSVRLDAGGIPLSWSVTGTSLIGAPVSETYSWAHGQAVWKSQADRGEVAAAKPPLYVLNDTSPWVYGIYARALLKAPSHQMPLLPTGLMTLTRVAELSTAAGSSLYRISGIDIVPTYVVLDKAGKLFATLTGPREATVREGGENQLPEVQRLVDAAAVALAKERAVKLSHRYPVPVRIRNVHIFDPRSGSLGSASTVVVMRERISSILPYDPSDVPPDDQLIVNGEGGTLVPGLHDMHSHTTEYSPLLDIAAGVTATRDMGNINSFLLGLIPRLDSGEQIGPRIVPNGFVEGRSAFSARLGRIAGTLEEALRAVDWYADRGYFQVKIYNSINPDWVKPIAMEAKRRGMGVTGHIPAFDTPDRAIQDGYDEITHINQLMLGWVLRPGEDTRTPLRLTGMARFADLDLRAAPVQATLKLMVERHIALDPTASIIETILLSRAGEIPPGMSDYLKHTPIGFQRHAMRTVVPLEAATDDPTYRRAFSKVLETVSLLHGLGVRLLPGTDAPVGFTVHRELELYTLAGLSPAEALRIGTLGCEEYLGRAQQLGTVERGKLADFFLIAGDPVRDIKAIKAARMVLKGGTVFFPSEIYESLGISPFASPPHLITPAASGAGRS
jgi:imidazolonepropionase-like amidohydrolase